MMGGGSGSTSVKTQTIIENGKKVTRTEKTKVDQYGTQTTEVTEERDLGNGRKEISKYALTGGEQH
jgi:hypothetical protein